MVSNCRRCSECRDMTHHWMHNPDFANYDADVSAELIEAHAVCKHCEATGQECPQCDGSGGVDSGGFTPWGESIDVPCPECDGEGFTTI